MIGTLEIVGGLIAASLAALYFGPDHQRFLAFTERRDRWHARCDEFVGKTQQQINAIYKPGTADERASDCQQELQEMTAYATSQGWH